jgi:outer membrane protein W
LNLRNIAVAVVLASALVAPRAQAEDLNVGWNTKHALLFQLQNVFSDGNGILNEYAGGIGVQRNLSATSAVRLSLSLSRFSDPAYETETQTGTGAVTKQDVIPSTTSSLSTTLRGSYLFRLSTSSIAPYLGVGGSLRYTGSAREGTNDDNTPGTTIEYDDSDTTFGLGLIGQLGLEWRVHRTVSLFAEYGLEVNAYQRTSARDSTTYNGVETRVESTRSKWMNFSTGLEQGGELGLIAYF